MPEPLVAWFTRLADDPRRFEATLGGRAVLVYDPPEPVVDDSSDDHRFRTVSGARSSVVGGGEPLVVLLAKSKDNVMQRRVTVGRTSNNDVVLDDASVSRFHAWFAQADDGTWQIVDAGSKNGTSVAAQKIAPKKPVALVNATRVRVGDLELTYYSAEGFRKMIEARAKS